MELEGEKNKIISGMLDEDEFEIIDDIEKGNSEIGEEFCNNCNNGSEKEKDYEFSNNENEVILVDGSGISDPLILFKNSFDDVDSGDGEEDECSKKKKDENNNIEVIDEESIDSEGILTSISNCGVEEDFFEMSDDEKKDKKKRDSKSQDGKNKRKKKNYRPSVKSEFCAEVSSFEPKNNEEDIRSLDSKISNGSSILSFVDEIDISNVVSPRLSHNKLSPVQTEDIGFSKNVNSLFPLKTPLSPTPSNNVVKLDNSLSMISPRLLGNDAFKSNQINLLDELKKKVSHSKISPRLPGNEVLKSHKINLLDELKIKVSKKQFTSVNNIDELEMLRGKQSGSPHAHPGSSPRHSGQLDSSVKPANTNNESGSKQVGIQRLSSAMNLKKVSLGIPFTSEIKAHGHLTSSLQIVSSSYQDQKKGIISPVESSSSSKDNKMSKEKLSELGVEDDSLEIDAEVDEAYNEKNAFIRDSLPDIEWEEDFVKKSNKFSKVFMSIPSFFPTHFLIRFIFLLVIGLMLSVASLVIVFYYTSLFRDISSNFTFSSYGYTVLSMIELIAARDVFNNSTLSPLSNISYPEGLSTNPAWSSSDHLSADREVLSQILSNLSIYFHSLHFSSLFGLSSYSQTGDRLFDKLQIGRLDQETIIDFSLKESECFLYPDNLCGEGLDARLWNTYSSVFGAETVLSRLFYYLQIITHKDVDLIDYDTDYFRFIISSVENDLSGAISRLSEFLNKKLEDSMSLSKTILIIHISCSFLVICFIFAVITYPLMKNFHFLRSNALRLISLLPSGIIIIVIIIIFT
jgi:hypothetical protein